MNVWILLEFLRGFSIHKLTSVMTNLRVLSFIADRRSPLRYLLPGIHYEEIVYRKRTANSNFLFLKFYLSERSLGVVISPQKIWDPNISQGLSTIHRIVNMSFFPLPVYQRHQDACETDLQFSTRELHTIVPRSDSRISESIDLLVPITDNTQNVKEFSKGDQ